jgi:hypothetical protein
MKTPVHDIEKFIPKEHQALLVRFFVLFSRFEYALKRAGFVTGSGGKVTANWDEFASKYNSVFNPVHPPGLQQAYTYFKEHPPRKQILKNGRLDWSKPNTLGKEPLLVWLLLCARIVRNNLFHGGKFPVAPIEEPARNSLLLGHALVIMETCLSLDTKTNRHFNTLDV